MIYIKLLPIEQLEKHNNWAPGMTKQLLSESKDRIIAVTEKNISYGTYNWNDNLPGNHWHIPWTITEDMIEEFLTPEENPEYFI
jgi:hypothetical protein